MQQSSPQIPLVKYANEKLLDIFPLVTSKQTNVVAFVLFFVLDERDRFTTLTNLKGLLKIKVKGNASLVILEMLSKYGAIESHLASKSNTLKIIRSRHPTDTFGSKGFDKNALASILSELRLVWESHASHLSNQLLTGESLYPSSFSIKERDEIVDYCRALQKVVSTPFNETSWWEDGFELYRRHYVHDGSIHMTNISTKHTEKEAKKFLKKYPIIPTSVIIFILSPMIMR